MWLHSPRHGREKMNEEHNKCLSDTVNKLLSESNKRLQLHLKERTATLAEKKSLLLEVENAKTQLEEMQHGKDQLRLNLEALRAELDQTRLRGAPSPRPTPLGQRPRCQVPRGRRARRLLQQQRGVAAPPERPAASAAWGDFQDTSFPRSGTR